MAGKKGLTTERVIAALRETNGNMSLAGRRLGVDRKAIAYYVNTYPAVKEAHDEAAEAVTDIAEGHLVSGVMKGQWEQVRYWLEQKARHRGYGRPQQHEITGADGAAIALTVFDHAAAVAALARRPAPHPDEPGADEGGGDGA